ALDAELALLLPEGEALVRLLHHEGGDVATARSLRIRDGHDGVEVGDARVGDPGLHAVEAPAVAVAHRTGLHGRGVGAGLTLGESVGEAVALRQPREVLLLDLLTATQLHREG